uniref:Uncharacterized protein n=1 Tax=Cucumis sativus TaxID=3659 RepID=A0A0A0KCK4_CUCSA
MDSYGQIDEKNCPQATPPHFSRVISNLSRQFGSNPPLVWSQIGFPISCRSQVPVARFKFQLNCGLESMCRMCTVHTWDIVRLTSEEGVRGP